MAYPAPYPRGTWRPNVPHEFQAMNRDDIVQTLLRFGYSRKAAVSEADAFLAYRDGPASSEQKGARNDSVSEKGPSNRFTDALARAFGRKGETDADERGSDTPIAPTQIASPQCCKSWRVGPAVSMPSYAVSATFF